MEEKPEVEICRDFEKGLCTRGKSCKFFHSPDSKPEGKLDICKDFRNRKCERAKCKFLHLSFAEEAIYNESGILPEHGGRPRSSFDQSYLSNFEEEQELCKDFLKNSCTRGTRCRYRHATEKELYLEKQLMSALLMNQSRNVPNVTQDPYGKRRRTDMPNPLLEENERLTEENEKLQRKITDLQKQVIELRQMNDTLYDQNTLYRNQIRGDQGTRKD